MKEWKDVVGYEGLYCVSNNGDVMNVSRNRILKRNLHITGYETVVLYKNGVPKRHLIHRIVATAFIPNEHKYEYVNHKDENKQNNNVENLEWCTRLYNMRYGKIKERISQGRGHGARQKRTVCQKDATGQLIFVYESIASASRSTGTARTSICECCNKKHKSANGYIWEYGVG